MVHDLRVMLASGRKREMRAGLLKDEWMDGWMDTLMSPRFPTADTEFFPLFGLLKKVAEKFLHGYISKVLSV